MILQALTQYYEDLLRRGDIAEPGWAPTKISYLLCLENSLTTAGRISACTCKEDFWYLL